MTRPGSIPTVDADDLGETGEHLVLSHAVVRPLFIVGQLAWVDGGRTGVAPTARNASCTSYSWIQPKSSGTRGHPFVARLDRRGRRAGAAGCWSPTSCAGSCGSAPAAVPGTAASAVSRSVALRLGEQRGEREGVLDGGVRALAVVGQHRRGRRRPRMTTRPRYQRSSGRTAEQRPPDRARRRPDHLGDRRMPARGTRRPAPPRPTSTMEPSCSQICGASTTAKKLTASPSPPMA